MAARQSRSTARTSAGLARSQDRWREQDYEIRLPPGRVPGLRTLSIEHLSGNHDCLTLADSYERIGLASPDDRIDAEMNGLDRTLTVLCVVIAFSNAVKPFGIRARARPSGGVGTSVRSAGVEVARPFCTARQSMPAENSSRSSTSMIFPSSCT